MPEITERVAMEIARKLIQKHEGFRERVYVDTVGVPTGGWGHAFLPNSWLPTYIWELIFEEDFAIARRDAEHLMIDYDIPHPGLPRKLVLIDMAFNLGYYKLKRFKRMFTSLKEKNYKQAAKQMLESKWATQVGTRAKALSHIMETGNYPNVNN